MRCGQAGGMRGRWELAGMLTACLSFHSRRRGEAASCTLVTDAPVSTGLGLPSCCWLGCCCCVVVGASQLGGEQGP